MGKLTLIHGLRFNVHLTDLADWAYTVLRSSKILQTHQFAIPMRTRTFLAKETLKSQTMRTRLFLKSEKLIRFSTYSVRRVPGSQSDRRKSRNSTNELAMSDLLFKVAIQTYSYGQYYGGFPLSLRFQIVREERLRCRMSCTQSL
jgi:hypothetical protein